MFIPGVIFAQTKVKENRENSYWTEAIDLCHIWSPFSLTPIQNLEFKSKIGSVNRQITNLQC